MKIALAFIDVASEKINIWYKKKTDSNIKIDAEKIITKAMLESIIIAIKQTSKKGNSLNIKLEVFLIQNFS
jgi:hypothetical protein